MHVMVFEGSQGGGHAFNYQRLLLPALAALTDDLIVVANEEVLRLPSTQVHLRDMPAGIQWDACVPHTSGSQFRQKLVIRGALKAALRRHRPDHLYVPTADTLSQVLGFTAPFDTCEFPFGLEAEAVVHRCGFAYPADNLAKQLLYRIGYWGHCHAPWTRFISVDLISYEWIQRHGGRLAERNDFLPDPIEDWPIKDRCDACRRLGLAEDSQWIGCVGAINERKGIDLLLAAFAAAPLPPNARLLLAGEHQSSIRELLNTRYAELVRAGRVVSLDRYLTVEELADTVAALQLVCTPYPRQIALASIVLRAAAGRRPVLATDFGWCGRVVPAFQLGWICNVRNIPEFAQAIARRLEQSSQWQPSPVAERLLEFHSPENFAATFTAPLCERLGKPRPHTVEWRDVEHFATESAHPSSD